MKREQTTAIIIAGLAVVGGLGAFWGGFYSPAQQLLLLATVAAVALTEAVRPEPGTPPASTGSEAAGLAMLGLGSLASLGVAATPGVAAHGPVVVAGWLLAFWLGRSWSERPEAPWWFLRFWAVLAPAMVMAGALAVQWLPAHHTGRMASFLGYPIAIGILGLLGLAGSLPDLAAGRWQAAFLATGSALGLFLAGSRGVWGAGLAMGVYLAWAAPALVRVARWPLLAGLAGALWAGPAIAARSPLPAVLTLLLACLTVSALAWFQQSAAAVGEVGRRRAAWILGAVTLLAVAFLAPGWQWLLGRAGALPLTEGSSLERLAFVRDSLPLIAAHPAGAGFKAWTALHLQAASYGYYSAEVHSSLLDLTLAFGWAAGAGFLLLLGGLLWRLRTGPAWEPERTAAAAAVAALGLHSLVDWTLSYGLFATVFWFGLGLAVPADPDRPRFRLQLPRSTAGALAAVTMAAAALLGAGDLLTEAATVAVERGRSDLAARHAAAAAALTPWNDQAHAAAGRAAAALGDTEGALTAIARARTLNRYEPWYAELAARELQKSGRWRAAATAYQDLVRLWPWHAPAYNLALESLMDMALRAVLRGDEALAADLSRSGRAVLEMLARQKEREPAATPRRPLPDDTPAMMRAREFFRH